MFSILRTRFGNPWASGLSQKLMILWYDVLYIVRTRVGTFHRTFAFCHCFVIFSCALRRQWINTYKQTNKQSNEIWRLGPFLQPSMLFRPITFWSNDFWNIADVIRVKPSFSNLLSESSEAFYTFCLHHRTQKYQFVTKTYLRIQQIRTSEISLITVGE